MAAGGWKEDVKKQRVYLTVNGESLDIWVEPNALLLNVLRDELGLTGVKYGCGTGQCGSCTVLVNDEPVLSCLTLARGIDGAQVLTIEGLGQPDGTLEPLQEAFLDHGAIQCGFCTPAMVLVGKSLLDKNPSPSESDVREQIKGTLCRCTGYTRIIRAIKSCGE
jgi:carbon-monoxide dehydrogenase small subunit